MPQATRTAGPSALHRTRESQTATAACAFCPSAALGPLIRCSSVRDSAAHGNELDYDRAGSVARLLARLLKSDGAIGAYNAAISQAAASASAATMDVCHAMCARTALGSALTHTHAHSCGSSSMCRLRLAAERLDQPQLAHAPTLEALLRASQAREHRNVAFHRSCCGWERLAATPRCVQAVVADVRGVHAMWGESSGLLVALLHRLGVAEVLTDRTSDVMAGGA